MNNVCLGLWTTRLPPFLKKLVYIASFDINYRIVDSTNYF